MLSNKDLYSEIVDAEKVRDGLDSNYEKAMLKMAILQVKLSHNLRTNIVSIMKFLKIPLVEPKQDREDK